jgi:hypothetical protein
MDHEQLNARLTKLEERDFALTCMQTFVAARTNALRDLLKGYFEEEGIHFHPTESFSEFFKGIEGAELDVILAGFADDNAAMAAAMKAWLEKVRI